MNNENLNELVLKVCLEENLETKEKLLRKWEELLDIDDIDFSSMRLMPFFYHQLQKDNIQTIHEKRLKVLYKYWWLKTNHLTDQLKIVCDNLESKNIEPIVLKGSNLMYYYPDPVFRPMSDIDLLVSYSQINETLTILKNLGYSWKNEEEFFINKFPKTTFDFYHAIGVKHEKLGVEIDLHWRTGSHLSYNFTTDLKKNLMVHQKIDTAKSPDLEYEICLTIFHAVVSKNRDNMNWILDVYILNEKAGKDIWKKVYEIAEKENKIDWLKYGISYLNEYGFNIPIIGNPVGNDNIRVLTLDKEIGEMRNPFKIFLHRFNNSVLAVNCYFPKVNAIKKTGHFFRFLFIQVLRYTYLYKRLV